jgi:four helix bundle protein
MARLVRFEDLEVWRRARLLTNEVYRVTGLSPLNRDFALRDQLRRAALSTMSNIAEGFESNSLRSFLRYVLIAKASAAEVRSQLYVAADCGLIERTLHGPLVVQVEELCRMLGGLIRSLHRKVKRRDAG